MTTDHRITDLLILWEQFQEMSAEELCKDCPELREAVAKEIDAMKRLKRRYIPQGPSPGGQKSQVKERPASNEPAPIPPDETSVAGYQVLKRLGKGAFGEVWSGRSGNRRVAMKFFHGDLNVPAESRRIDLELNGLGAIWRLTHPHLIKIHDLREYTGAAGKKRIVLIMELAEESLEKYCIKQGRAYPLAAWCALRRAMVAWACASAGSSPAEPRPHAPGPQARQHPAGVGEVQNQRFRDGEQTSGRPVARRRGACCLVPGRRGDDNLGILPIPAACALGRSHRP